MNDYLNGATKLVDYGDGGQAPLEVEFLLGKVGAGYEVTLETNLGGDGGDAKTHGHAPQEHRGGESHGP